MKTKQIMQNFRIALWSYLFESEPVRPKRLISEVLGIKRRAVWWIDRDEMSIFPCWIDVYEYEPGFIRLTNQSSDCFPAARWPTELPVIGGKQRFEITFHESELQCEFSPSFPNNVINEIKLLVELCRSGVFLNDFQLFAPGRGADYLWSCKAEEIYKQRHKGNSLKQFRVPVLTQ